MNVSGPDDPTGIIAALRADLDTGFAEMYDAYRTPVYTAALRGTGSRPDAEDLTAETFLRAYRSLISAAPPPLDTLRPRAWLLTILLNAVRNHHRGRARKPPPGPLDTAPEPTTATPGPAELAERGETGRALADRLSALPTRQREAVILRHVLDLPIAEVARILAVPDGTAKSHVSRGLSALRASMTAPALHEAHHD